MSKKSCAKEKLVKVGRSLFAAKGFRDTSVREIVKEAGVNLSAVSYHFSGKSELYKACFEDFARSRIGVLSDTLTTPKNSETFRQALLEFGQGVAGTFDEEPELAKFGLRKIFNCLEQGDSTEQLALAENEPFERAFKELASSLVAFFQEAKDHHLVNHEVRPVFAAGLFLGLISLALERRPMRQEDQLLNTFLNGIAC